MPLFYRRTHAIILAMGLVLVLWMSVACAEEKKVDVSGQWAYVLEEDGITITGFLTEPIGVLLISNWMGIG